MRDVVNELDQLSNALASKTVQILEEGYNYTAREDKYRDFSNPRIKQILTAIILVKTGTRLVQIGLSRIGELFSLKVER